MHADEKFVNRPYYLVSDLDAALAKVKDGGGMVAQAWTDIMPEGNRAASTFRVEWSTNFGKSIRLPRGHGQIPLLTRCISPLYDTRERQTSRCTLCMKSRSISGESRYARPREGKMLPE
jgi:hypothetical protein